MKGVATEGATDQVPGVSECEGFEMNDKVIGLHSRTQCWYSGDAAFDPTTNYTT